MTTVAQRIEALNRQISAAAEKAGRDPGGITLMAVTKNHPSGSVIAAAEAGITCFGENRVLEAVEKYRNLNLQENLHMIGHLQSNKVAKAVALFSWIDSVDSLKLAGKLAAAAHRENRQLQILLEINVSGDAAKYGFAGEDEAFRTLEFIAASQWLTPRGFMTLGPLHGGLQETAAAFVRLRRIHERAQSMYPELPLDTLSMGMSGDWEVAIAEGSTMIRLGTAIFGSRTD